MYLMHGRLLNMHIRVYDFFFNVQELLALPATQACSGKKDRLVDLVLNVHPTVTLAPVRLPARRALPTTS